jgi:hypothetical protein
VKCPGQVDDGKPAAVCPEDGAIAGGAGGDDDQGLATKGVAWADLGSCLPFERCCLRRFRGEPGFGQDRTWAIFHGSRLAPAVPALDNDHRNREAETN